MGNAENRSENLLITTADPDALSAHLGFFGRGVLDVADGRFRQLDGRPLYIKARTDIEAIACWLENNRTVANTYRAYRREVRRLLSWAVFVRRRAVSDLDMGDMREFIAWMKTQEYPPDAPQEIAALFRGRLSDNSIRLARIILKAMFDWLVAVGYLAGNPLATLKTNTVVDGTAKRKTAVEKGDHFFPLPLWRWIKAALERLPEIALSQAQADFPHKESEASANNRKSRFRNPWPPARYERVRFAVYWLYGAGPRRSEFVNGTTDQLSRNHITESWLWTPIGKGDKEETVVINAETMAALVRYRLSLDLKLSPYPAAEKSQPLIMQLHQIDAENLYAITDSMLYRELRAMFVVLERELREKMPDRTDWQADLRNASTHWLRHTIASHLAQSGAKEKVVAQHLRHKSATTTKQYYVHVDLAEQERAINEACLRLELPSSTK